MHLRPLTALAATLLLAGAAPMPALASSAVERVLAQSGEGESNLSQTPPSGLSAQGADEASGDLTGDPPAVPGDAEAAEPTAELPFTGAEPLLTLLLGSAAVLTGAGLRLRTGDASDY